MKINRQFITLFTTTLLVISQSAFPYAFDDHNRSFLPVYFRSTVGPLINTNAKYTYLESPTDLIEFSPGESYTEEYITNNTKDSYSQLDKLSATFFPEGKQSAPCTWRKNHTQFTTMIGKEINVEVNLDNGKCLITESQNNKEFFTVTKINFRNISQSTSLSAHIVTQSSGTIRGVNIYDFDQNSDEIHSQVESLNITSINEHPAYGCGFSNIDPAKYKNRILILEINSDWNGDYRCSKRFV